MTCSFLVKKIFNLAIIFFKSLLFRFKYFGVVGVAEKINVSSLDASFGVMSIFYGELKARTGLFYSGDRVIISRGVTVQLNKFGKIYIGNDVQLNSGTSLLSSGAEIFIGDRVTLSEGCHIQGDINIGHDTMLGPNVYMSSGKHVAINKTKIRQQDLDAINSNRMSELNAPILIGSDCWLGVNSVVMPGVKLGHGCVVAAGSVVTRSFPNYSVIGGIPAQLIRYRA
jgi:acetyltransferase-like isoleucine patch superfamily enzyme